VAETEDILSGHRIALREDMRWETANWGSDQRIYGSSMACTVSLRNVRRENVPKTGKAIFLPSSVVWWGEHDNTLIYLQQLAILLYRSTLLPKTKEKSERRRSFLNTMIISY
jgi:hypothetical protein